MIVKTAKTDIPVVTLFATDMRNIRQSAKNAGRKCSTKRS